MKSRKTVAFLLKACKTKTELKIIKGISSLQKRFEEKVKKSDGYQFYSHEIVEKQHLVTLDDQRQVVQLLQKAKGLRFQLDHHFPLFLGLHPSTMPRPTLHPAERRCFSEARARFDAGKTPLNGLSTRI